MAKRHPDREADLRARLRQDPKVKELIEAHALAEGFHFSVVCAPPVVADALAALVPAEAGKKGGRKYHPVVIDAYAGEHPSPLTLEFLAGRVLARLLQGGQDIPPGKTPLYFLDASRMQPADGDAWRALFRRMNETRNRIIRDVDAPVILVLPAEWDVEFAQNAPDMWSVGSYQARLSLAMPVAAEYALEHRRRGERERAKGVWGGEDIPKLLKEIEKARKVAKARPGDAAAVRRLMLLLERWGRAEMERGDLDLALEAWRGSQTALEGLLQATAHPLPELVREKLVICVKIGDVLFLQGKLSRALEVYREGLAISIRLIDSNPSVMLFHIDLSASHGKIGEVLQAQGDLSGALNEYQSALDVYNTISDDESVPLTWRRGLAVCQEKIGDILQLQGDLEGALHAYRKSLETCKCVIQADKKNVMFRRDLSVSYNKVGDALHGLADFSGALREYQAAISIAKELVGEDPYNMGLQWDLASGYHRLGLAMYKQGDLSGARDAYMNCTEILASLLGSEPKHAAWQRDMVISLSMLGSVQVGLGEFDKALASYENSLQKARWLSTLDPSRPEWRNDLGNIYASYAELYMKVGNYADAVNLFKEAYSILSSLAKEFPTIPSYRHNLSLVNMQLSQARQAQNTF